MNNILSHCGLVDARITSSEKDLPVCSIYVRKPEKRGVNFQGHFLNESEVLSGHSV